MESAIFIARNQVALSDAITGLKQAGKVAFVPTMGSLHEGHMSLIDVAKEHADSVVVSVFVNPKQFSPNEDFDLYPRDEDRDIEMLKEAGTNAVFLPGVNTIYPDGKHVDIAPHPMGGVMEGQFRPQFFHGVCMVVKRLFDLVMPDIAVFGEKDFQQLWVVEQMVKEYNLPIKIISAPTIREEDGLAYSSRNVYLNKKERQSAAAIYTLMNKFAEKLKQGETVKELNLWAESVLLDVGFSKVDYIETRESKRFEPIFSYRPEARIFVAAHLGKVRLIDNMKI